MEFSMKVVIVTILAIVVALMLIMFIGAWSGQANTSVGNFFDFFGNMMGGGQELPK